MLDLQTKHMTCNTDCTSCTDNYNEVLVGLDQDMRLALDDQKSQISYKKGEHIFKEGMYPNGLFCLRKGKVMITKTDLNGNTVIINLLRDVTFLGVPDYILSKPYQTKCIALEDSEICLLNKDNVDLQINENKPFARSLMLNISDQYNQSNSRILALTKKNMNARLADALLELLDAFGTNEDGFLDVYMKRSELGMLTNMSDSNVIRNLSAFQKTGIISLVGKQIKILKLNKLQQESQTF